MMVSSRQRGARNVPKSQDKALRCRVKRSCERFEEVERQEENNEGQEVKDNLLPNRKP